MFTKRVMMVRGEKNSTSFPVFLDEEATSVAKKLLGCYLVRDLGDHQMKARIVETEAYDQTDAASHSFNGRTSRTDVMFGPSGHLYVYFTYGMHYCSNVVTGKSGSGQGVLIRAVEPVEGEDYMKLHRGVGGHSLTNGPAKLCQALNIDKAMNGHSLRMAPLRLEIGQLRPLEQIEVSERIGISKARDELRRFYIAGNPYVSKVRRIIPNFRTALAT